MCPDQIQSPDELRARIVQEAKTWIGTRWHHLARSKGVGVDCAQFLIAVFSAVGLVEDFDTGYYSMDWHLNREEPKFLKFLMTYADLVPDDQIPLPGDIVMWKYGRHAAHGSIVVEWPLIIHAWRDEGYVTLTDITIADMGGRHVGAYRLRGLV